MNGDVPPMSQRLYLLKKCLLKKNSVVKGGGWEREVGGGTRNVIKY